MHNHNRYRLRSNLSILCSLSLFGLALILYKPSLYYSALSWDDQDHIFRNAWLISGHLDDILKFWQQPYFNLYIPVTYTIWSMVYKLCVYLNVEVNYGLHLLNILLHASNAVLLFRLCRVIGVAVLPAWFLTLLFVVHPLQVGAVAWISGGRDLLACCLGLMALNLSVGHLNYWRSIGAIGLFVAAFLAKPSTITLPIAAYFLSSNRSSSLIRLITVSLIAGVAVAIINKSQQNTVDLDWQAPLWFRLPIAIDALVFYCKKIFIPWPLTADYGRNPEALYQTQSWLVSVGCFLAVMIFSALRWRQGRLPLSVLSSLALFCLILLPVLGLIPFSFQNISTVTDHYAYIVWIAAIPISKSWLPDTSLALRRWIGLGVFTCICLLLISVTRRQLPIWSNNYVFYEHMIEVNPKSFNGYVNLAAALIEAKQDSALAEKSLKSALSLEPGHTIPLYYLTRILLASQRYQDLISHITPWSQAGADTIHTRYRANPAYNRHLWSWIELHLALAYHRLGQAELAHTSVMRGITYDANNAYIYYHQGRILNEQGDLVSARAAWQKALSRDPNNPLFQSINREMR